MQHLLGMAKFVTRIPVRFADIDHAGIVYYPRFYHYFHVAFEEMFRARMGPRGYRDLLSVRQIGFPAVSSKCTYLAPLRFGDEVDIGLWTQRVGDKSVTFGYEALIVPSPQVRSRSDVTSDAEPGKQANSADPVRSATAEIVTAVVDLAKFSAISIPEDLRRLFLELSCETQVKTISRD